VPYSCGSGVRVFMCLSALSSPARHRRRRPGHGSRTCRWRRRRTTPAALVRARVSRRLLRCPRTRSSRRQPCTDAAQANSVASWLRYPVSGHAVFASGSRSGECGLRVRVAYGNDGTPRHRISYACLREPSGGGPRVRSRMGTALKIVCSDLTLSSPGLMAL